MSHSLKGKESRMSTSKAKKGERYFWAGLLSPLLLLVNWPPSAKREREKYTFIC